MARTLGPASDDFANDAQHHDANMDAEPENVDTAPSASMYRAPLPPVLVGRQPTVELEDLAESADEPWEEDEQYEDEQYEDEQYEDEFLIPEHWREPPIEVPTDQEIENWKKRTALLSLAVVVAITVAVILMVTGDYDYMKVQGTGREATVAPIVNDTGACEGMSACHGYCIDILECKFSDILFETDFVRNIFDWQNIVFLLVILASIMLSKYVYQKQYEYQIASSFDSIDTVRYSSFVSVHTWHVVWAAYSRGTSYGLHTQMYSYRTAGGGLAVRHIRAVLPLVFSKLSVEDTGNLG